MSDVVSSNPLDVERVRGQVVEKSILYYKNEKFTDNIVEFLKILWTIKKDLWGILEKIELKDVIKKRNQINEVMEQIVIALMNHHDANLRSLKRNIETIVLLIKDLIKLFVDTRKILKEKGKTKDVNAITKKVIGPLTAFFKTDPFSNYEDVDEDKEVTELKNLFSNDSYTKRQLYTVLNVPL